MCQNVQINQMCLFAQSRRVKMMPGSFYVKMESIASLRILSVMDMHNVRMGQVCIKLLITSFKY